MTVRVWKPTEDQPAPGRAWTVEDGELVPEGFDPIPRCWEDIRADPEKLKRVTDLLRDTDGD